MPISFRVFFTKISHFLINNIKLFDVTKDNFLRFHASQIIRMQIEIPIDKFSTPYIVRMLEKSSATNVWLANNSKLCIPLSWYINIQFFDYFSLLFLYKCVTNMQFSSSFIFNSNHSLGFIVIFCNDAIRSISYDGVSQMRPGYLYLCNFHRFSIELAMVNSLIRDRYVEF